MFAKVLLISILALIAWAVVARASQGAGRPVHYTVRRGDTLWSLAASRYGGDPRDGVWKIERANHLAAATIVPGQPLLLP